MKCNKCATVLPRGDWTDHQKKCGASAAKKEEKNSSKEQQQTVIVIEDSISLPTFQRILEFLYCGQPTIEDETTANNVKKAADLFELNHLVTICENYLSGNVELNPSIGGVWIFIESNN